MTQLQNAQQGQITPAMQLIATQENREPEFIRAGIAEGTIAILTNLQSRLTHKLLKRQRLLTGGSGWERSSTEARAGNACKVPGSFEEAV